MKTVDDELAKVTPEHRVVLEHIRGVIAAHVPDAEEAISYGMPAFKYKGKYLIGYYAYDDHLSVFPSPGPIVALKDKLAGYTQAKGTVQFTLDHPLPDDVLTQLVDVRIKEINKG